MIEFISVVVGYRSLQIPTRRSNDPRWRKRRRRRRQTRTYHRREQFVHLFFRVALRSAVRCQRGRSFFWSIGRWSSQVHRSPSPAENERADCVFWIAQTQNGKENQSQQELGNYLIWMLPMNSLDYWITWIIIPVGIEFQCYLNPHLEQYIFNFALKFQISQRLICIKWIQ